MIFRNILNQFTKNSIIYNRIQQYFKEKEIDTMKKAISALLVSAMTVMFAVGCAAEDETPDAPTDTPVETPADEPADEPADVEESLKVTSLLEGRELTADEQESLEKVVKFMRTVEDTVQVSLFEMTEVEGGFNMEFVMKNNFAETTTVEEGTIIQVTSKDSDAEIIEIPVPKSIEIEPNAGVLFETEVMTDVISKRTDIYFIEFKAEEEAE